jgi:WD40 repeat protein/DNA-binding SARP family transcriptional activator/energy-coupling factor transporter ATP-binding protein EcfA2
MEVRLLGPLEVRHCGRVVPLGGYRQRLVLGVLLLNAERIVSTDWLIDAVWGEEPPRTARKTLQVYISRLRKLLGPAVIDATPHGYVLHITPDSLDVHRFESLAASGRRLGATDPIAAAGAFRQSLALWRGMPWGELGYEHAIQPEAQRLRQLRLAVLEDRISADLESGRALGLVGELEGLVDDHPLRERFRFQLMLALYQSGRQADALRLFRETRRILGEELGIEPSRELQDLEEKILLQDPSIDRPETTAPAEDWALARNPYKGLRSFTQQDAADFFGRNDLVDELFGRIEKQPFVAVVGASGSGKSSAVMAGLLPRLQSTETRGTQDWLVITMVPGRRPFDELTAAIRRSIGDGAARFPPVVPADNLSLLRAIQDAVGDDTRRALLFIDQFEELFHQVADDTERRLFLGNLVEAVEDPHSQLTVLITLRADYFDRALSGTSIGPLIDTGLVNVLPLVPADLEAAAARPAEQVGAHIEPELIAELVADMTDQPGSLPLFQYVLTQLFDERAGLVLTRSAYRRLGGLRGALARRAEDVYQTLDEGQQAATRQILLRMVTVGEDQEQSRRRVARDELESLAVDPGTVQVALDAFDDARLLTFDRSPVTGQATVEVAHEALLRGWPRLRGWLDEAREDLRLHRALVSEVDEWEASGRDPDYLLIGSRLDLYADRDSAIELTGPEQDFIAASNDRREDERKAEKGRQEQELQLKLRAVRRLRWLVAVVSIAALVAIALTVFANNRSRQASSSQREARARELANASLANLDTDPELAILLALQSIETTRATDGLVLREAEEALHLAVGTYRIVGQHDGAWPLAFHPDGGLFLGGSSPQLIDPVSGATLVETPALPQGWIAESVAISSDGALLATGTDHGGEIVVSEANSGAELTRLRGPVGTICAMTFSPDSRMLTALRLSYSAGRLHVVGDVHVWDIATGKQVAGVRDTEIWDAEGPPVDMTFSPDGSLIAVTTMNGDRFLAGEVRLLDVASNEWVMTLRGHEGPVTGVEYLVGGSTIVTASMDGSVRFWDAATGEQISSFDADVGQVVSMDVSNDGSRLLTGGDGGALKLWTLQSENARLAAELLGHSSGVAAVDLDGPGDLGASVDFGGSVLVWNVAPDVTGEVAAWPAIRPVAFSNDDRFLATTGPNGRDVVIRRTADWQAELVIDDVAPFVGLPDEEWGSVTGMSFSPEGDRLVTATGSRSEAADGSVTLWDTTTGLPIRTLLKHPFMKGPVVFSGDGGRVAAATCDLPGTPATVWDVDSGDVVFAAPSARCGQAVDLDDTGRLVAVLTLEESQPNVQVWDTQSGELVLAVKHMPQWIGAVVFSPDGTRLLTGGGDGTARIWDIATGDLVRTLTGHTGSVEDAAWSADGAEIITGSHDGTVRLWDAATGETRLVLGGLDTFSFVDITADGRYLATGTDFGVRIWALDLDELTEIARTRVPRSLTAAECIAYYFDECP